MNALVGVCAGFLFAVLWFDLMFDVQAFRRSGDRVPEEALASISGYYQRVTRDARPMNRLIALVMLVTLAGVVVEIARGEGPLWVAWASLVVAAAPILLAGARVLPRAERLATREDSLDRQSELARSIAREHVLCAASIAVLLALQLSSA